MKKTKIEDLEKNIDAALDSMKQKGCGTYSRYDPEEKSWTLRELVRQYEMMCFCPRVQTRLGGPDNEGGWDQQNFEKFLNAVLEQISEMDRILIADLQLCYQNTKDKCSYSEKYYKEKMALDKEDPWNEGTPNGKYKTINVDGGNTVRFLAGFVLGNVTFEGRAFKDFSKDLQERFLDTITFDVTILRNITARELAKLFRARNSGPALNRQQIRSSRLTEHADSIRDLVSSLRDLFLAAFNKKNRDKLHPDEHVATYVQFESMRQAAGTLPSKKVDHAMLDEQYDELEECTGEELEKLMNPIKKFFKTVESAFQGVKIQSAEVLHTVEWAIYGVQNSVNFKIADPAIFRDAVLNLKDKVETNWSNLHVDEKGTDKSVLAELNPSKMLFNLGKQSANGKAWFEVTIANIEQDLEKAGLQPEERGEWLKNNWGISFRRKESDRYTFSEKVAQWRKQGGIVKTSDGDKEVSFAQIVLGIEEVEGDHKIPFAKTGETTRGNLQVISKELNRKKSDKVAEA